MAKQLTLTSKYNGVCNKSYFLISKIIYDKLKGEGFINFSVFENQNIKNTSGKKPFTKDFIKFGEGEKNELLGPLDTSEDNTLKLVQIDIKDIKIELDELIKKIYTIIEKKSNIYLEGQQADLTKATKV
jgi:hypothetical protein